MTRYIVFDVETPNSSNNRMSAIGITVVENGEITDSYFSLVDPESRFDRFNIQLTGISPESIKGAPAFPELWEEIEPLMSSGILVAHNAVFDMGVLKKCLHDYCISWKSNAEYICTVQIGRKLLPGISHSLNVMCEHYGIALSHHQADSDSNACAELFIRYMQSGADMNKFIRTYKL